MNRKIKNTAIAHTSIQAYRELIASGQISKEKAHAIKTMIEFKDPITRRKLAKLTGLEISALCRILYDLRKAGIAGISHYGTCEETKKNVAFYALIQGQLELI